MVNTLVPSSDVSFNQPLLDWLKSDSNSTDQDIWVHSSDTSDLILREISALQVSLRLAPKLLSVFSALFYRYSYQSEFELQYIELGSGNSFDAKEIVCSKVQFVDHASQSITELSANVHKALYNAESHDTNRLLSESGFCLIDASGVISDVSHFLLDLFAQHEGVVWPIIESCNGTCSLKWLCSKKVSVDSLNSMQTHLLNLVLGVKSQPSLAHSAHELLSKAEILQQLDFAPGDRAEVSSQPVYKCVEEFARTQPEKIAVRFGGAEFSYAEINRRANNLASALLAAGSDIGSHVAVVIEPSEDILVAFLAIHKIGCVYVPIDPTFPPARIKTILEEVNPSAILCQDIEADIFGTKTSVLLNISACMNIDSSPGNPDVPVSGSNISHIFFTSGTTGKPKGTLATHKNLIHYISAAKSRYRFNGDDNFISAARFTFSISLFELVTPLYAGGSVNILPRDSVLDMKRLCLEVANSTVFHFGPSLLKQLLPYIEERYDSYEVFDGLRHVSSGGDMVPPEILGKLKKIFRKAEVFVIYGSSEISCMGCTYEVPRDKTITETLVGRPHQNVGVRIFDNNGKMVPMGVAGRIHFSGGGIIQGYLNMPELTKEKFVDIEGERFYDIGDIGRFDSQGRLQLLGREDFQVQLRGMRIELLEIEGCLKSHPAVLDCVIVAKLLKSQDEKSLIAYVVLDQEMALSANELIGFASQNLPDYMVPSVFVNLDKLPVNHNGKLDRTQLPEPTVENMMVSASFEGASNKVEQELIFMWESLFGIQGIGIDHDFFELGGDSLLAVNFLIEVDKRFDKFIPISLLMQASTISALAAIIMSDDPADGVGDVVVLRKGNSEPPLFCLYGVLLYKDLAESIDTERMICGVYLEQEVGAMGAEADDQALEVLSTVEGIVSCYLDRIRAFQPHGPYYLCGESFGGIIALEASRQLEKEGEEVRLVAMLDSVAPGFYGGLSKSKRILKHMKQLRRHGLSYLKRKLDQRLPAKNREYEDVEILSDVRGKIRENASSKYYPEKYEGRVTLFKASERSEFEPESDDLGWGKFIQNLEVLDIDGTHLSILKKGNVEKLASLMLDRMD